VRYRIVHNTTYEHLDSAEACHNLVRLQPRTMRGQLSRETRLTIEPTPASMHAYLDYFGNRVHSFAIYQPHQKLSITAESNVVIDRDSPGELSSSPSWEEVRVRLQRDRTPEVVDALEFVFDSPYVATGRTVLEFASEHFTPGRPLLDAAFELTRYIKDHFKYDPEATTIDTSVEDVLEKRHGVCQDFAHLQIACLRSLGLSCRYVSGYLRTDPQPGKPRLIGADASHAWVGVYLPGGGWIDFDPTNGCMANDRHITIGWGRDFHDVSPVKGVMHGGGESTLSVSVDVQPL
jgi:transglutaminase-like putative cysteine protease